MDPWTSRYQLMHAYMLAKKVAQRNNGTPQLEALHLLKKWHKGTPQYATNFKGCYGVNIF